MSLREPFDTTPGDGAPGRRAWTSLLPALEAQVEDELKTFRKSMKAAQILPDFTNRDVFPPSKSGAWKIFHAEGEDEAGNGLAFTIYVRRKSGQLAVNENGGHPYVLGPNFTRAFPWAPPTAEELAAAMRDRMRSLGVQPQ